MNLFKRVSVDTISQNFLSETNSQTTSSEASFTFTRKGFRRFLTQKDLKWPSTNEIKIEAQLLIRKTFGKLTKALQKQHPETPLRIRFQGTILCPIGVKKLLLLHQNKSIILDLSQSILVGDFTGFNFKGINFQGANLRNAQLKLANLQGANFKNAYLKWANLYGAHLQNAKFEGTHFEWKWYPRHSFW